MFNCIQQWCNCGEMERQTKMRVQKPRPKKKKKIVYFFMQIVDIEIP